MAESHTDASYRRSMIQIDSTDAMREKLEKWRCMKGKRCRASQDATNVYSRSRSAVAIGLPRNNKFFATRSSSSASVTLFNSKNDKKRRKTEPHVPSRHETMKDQTRYRRISDDLEDSICAKNRGDTFLLEEKNSSPNVTTVNKKSYKDKSLSMSERLRLWRAEKRKSNPEKAKLTATKVKRKFVIKEHISKYHNLDKENGRFSTPSSSKPLSRTQTKSTIKKTRFVTPSSNRNMTVRQNTLQCDKKSPGRTVNVADTSVKASGKNENAKSYKDKSLQMRERLELWLAEKGKTPKYKTPAPVKKSRISQQENLFEKKRLSFDCCADHDNAQMGQFSGISPCEVENIEERLEECLLQLEKMDCDTQKVAAQLDLFKSFCPHIPQLANYWLCQAKIAQQQRDYNRVVCLYEQALVFKAQPESILKDAVCDFVKFMREDENQEEAPQETEQVPESPTNEFKAGDKKMALEEFNSSIIKFCLAEATPYRRKFKQTFGKSILTPVRRSVRLEQVNFQHPPMLQEHDLTVRRLSELPEDARQNLLFKPNFAIAAELNEAWSKLQLDYTG
ncbi:cytoskeleton-associated protein 2-like isoform X2 [Acropora muricata]|uniref:cytoskeleton-associated protein 2-like isoform X2 n=1 Tax=Acropora muricata TaxID=159855 RepID=UPI0034E56BAB